MPWRAESDIAANAASLGLDYEPTPIRWPPQRRSDMCVQSRIILSRWEAMWEAQKDDSGNSLCFWCREPMSDEPMKLNVNGDLKPNDSYATEEHLLRRRDGGKSTRKNLRLAHASCNRKRDQKNHLPRYAHDPYPVRKPNAHPGQPHAVLGAAGAQAAAPQRGAVLSTRPVAPLVPGQRSAPAHPARRPAERPWAEDRPAAG